MLKIRDKQMTVMGEALINELFIEEAVTYLDHALEQNTAFYGRDAVIATVLYGIERAHSYGIALKRDVCLYLRLMFTLMGSDFDRDPLYPWAAQILSDTYHPPNDRIMRLTGSANRLLNEIQSRETEYFKKILASCRSNPFSDLEEKADPAAIAQATLQQIGRSFPGKLQCVGEENTVRLITRGIDDAQMLGMERGSDIAAFVFFMFVHGVKFHCDPKYPQSREIFSNPSLSGSQKVDAMFVAARDFLHRKLHLLRVG